MKERNEYKLRKRGKALGYLIYLLSSHKANVLGTGTPAEPRAFITLKSGRVPKIMYKVCTPTGNFVQNSTLLVI